MKALIAGAGIGGLTTALFLYEAGIEVKVFEQSPAVRELGVGINLLPHAVRELSEVGLLDDLDREGIRTRELIYANRFGQTVWRELRGIDAGYEVPQFSIHRGMLPGLLHRAVVDRLGPGSIHMDCGLAGFEEQGGHVVARLQRGDSGGHAEASGDVLIGADGIHSTVRSILYPKEGPPVWSGIMLWRGTVQWPVWRDGRTMAIAGGNAAKFVFYPIRAARDHPEMRLTNWGIMARSDDRSGIPPRHEDWNRPGRLDEVLPFVRDRFRLDFVDPVDLIEASGTFYEYPNCDRDPLPRWSFGSVTLLGDAAHPMYPVGSNGASQAILDARCLARHLTSDRGVQAALVAYDEERRPPIAEIVLANRKGGPEGVIDMVESRAPNGFDDIETIASHAEREAVVRSYAALAGYARQQVNEEHATGRQHRTRSAFGREERDRKKGKSS